VTIRLNCAGCGFELPTEGAMLLGQPMADGSRLVRHLCAECSKAVEKCLAYIDARTHFDARRE
jgi:hypothetical protein